MKIIFITIALLALTGCPTLPNKPTCLADGFDDNGIPTHGRCIYPQAIPDFVVDNTGENNYTLDGHNWTLAELIKNSFITPPETVAATDQFFLDYCHDYPDQCPVPSASAAVKDYEYRLMLRAP